MRILLALALLAYPAIVFMLAERAAPLAMACLFAVIAAPRLLLAKHLSKGFIILGLCAVAALCVATALVQSVVAVKLYPAVMSASAALWCAYTLFEPPSAIERLLILLNRSASGLPQQLRARIPLAMSTDASSPETSEIAPSDVQRTYLRGLTTVWLVFFTANALVALYTATAKSTGTWALYNGAVSYALIALVVGLEVLYRPIYQRRYEPVPPIRHTDPAHKQQENISDAA